MVKLLSANRARVELCRHRGEWFSTEDGLDRQAEVFGGTQGEVQAGVVLASLQIANGLVVDRERVRQLLPRHAALRSQHGEAVVQDGLAALRCAWHQSSIGT